MPPNFIDAPNGVIDNPTALFEVLSPSTAFFDRVAKFAFYRTLDSLRDYVLIESERPKIEVFSLEDGDWKIRTYTGLDLVAIIPSVDIRLPLAELYRHAELDDVPAER